MSTAGQLTCDNGPRDHPKDEAERMVSDDMEDGWPGDAPQPGNEQSRLPKEGCLPQRDFSSRKCSHSALLQIEFWVEPGAWKRPSLLSYKVRLLEWH